MGSQVLEPGAQTATHLYDERIAIIRIIVLQPQHPRVDVRHECPAIEDVGAESGVCTLGNAAIIPNLWEAREQHPDLGVKASPGRMKRRLISWSKQDRVGTTIDRAACPHVQWRVIDLQAERPPLLLLTAEAHAKRRAAPLKGPTERCQHADRRSERAVQQLRLLLFGPPNANDTLARPSSALMALFGT